MNIAERTIIRFALVVSYFVAVYLTKDTPMAGLDYLISTGRMNEAGARRYRRRVSWTANILVGLVVIIIFRYI